MAKTILIVDDELALWKILLKAMSGDSYRIFDVGTGREARQVVEAKLPDLVLLDLGLPDEHGLSVLQWLHNLHPAIGVMIISGTGTLEMALKAGRYGALDYLHKPVDFKRLNREVQTALQRVDQARQIQAYSPAEWERLRMVGSSRAMAEVFEFITVAGPSEVPALIQGESGVGKELVANALHANSQRRRQAYIKLNCAALPQDLIESELFGYTKGAFTGATTPKAGKVERADGGTLFLDEIGDMSLLTQAKILRFLQEGELEQVGSTKSKRVNVRIIASTNKDLYVEMRAGRFREDLYYRLNVISIRVPPLRKRKGDIAPLVAHFINKHGRQKGFRVRGISPAVLKRLQDYNWPGNVRELENVIARSIIFCPGEVINEVQIPRGGPVVMLQGPFQERVAEFSRSLILKALEKNHWNCSKAARELELPRGTLAAKMKKLNISKPSVI